MEGNINMLHTSNTASIKLNSNVVTEFPRSKKLIKYPRVAMTQNDESATSGYVASASNFNASYPAWEAFDGSPGVGDATTRWQPQNTLASAGVLRYTDPGSGPWVPTTSFTDNITTIADGSTIRGDWLQLESPDKVNVKSYRIYNSTSYVTDYNAHTVVLLGSNTGINDWVYVGSGERDLSWSNTTATTSGNHVSTVAIENTPGNMGFYRYHRLIVTKVTHQHLPVIFQLELFGVPEYDPEAHGTDVVVKSEANVPNTDWLEVYYDAKNYTNGVVQDETANNRDGTLYGNTSLNSADGIHKFDFDGNGDYIKTTLTGFTGTTVTFSLWVFIDSIAAGRANTLMAIGSWNPNAATFCAIDSNGLFELGTHSITNVKAGPAAVGEWVHLTGIAMSNNYRIYKNGQLISSNSDSGSINYGTNPVLYLATRANSSGNPEATRYTDCKIANARLFNRALTTDEIYQLYAYQKEYFGYGDLSMTLKAGRLGIGTSEPRAALDVRGRIMREYNPGEIIEEINTVCNGRPVTVQSGTYTPTNVTSSQTSSHTHTEINGSNITYSKPAGAKRIYYKFACHWEDAGNGALTNFKIQIYHNGAWQDINPSRYLHSAQYQNDGNNHGSMWVINEYIFECDADTESQHDGYFLSSKTSYTFRVVWRHHGTSGYESILHQNDWWDGTSTNILHPPQLTIRAIA
jgi:hypothetical protein